MESGLEYIKKELERIRWEEGRSLYTDVAYNQDEELCRASASYACAKYLDSKETQINIYETQVHDCPEIWPWAVNSFKPTPNDRIKELSKAGALIACEIERLLFLKKVNSTDKK